MQHVTVVMPSYNSDNTVADAISSCLNQQTIHVDVVVVDDGSTDGSGDRVRATFRSDNRVRVFTQRNAGPAAARNRGLGEVVSDLVVFVDADDLLYPAALRSQADWLRDHPDTIAVGGLCDYLSADGTRRRGISGQAPRVVDQAALRRAELVPFPIMTALCRTDAVRAVGGFSEDPCLRYGAEDLDFWARMARYGRIDMNYRLLASYRVHDRSLSAARWREMVVATRFVQTRVDHPGLRWSDFRGSADAIITRLDRARAHYRRAAAAFLNRRRMAASLHLIVALAVGPTYVGRRLRAQAVPRDRDDAGNVMPL